MAYIGYKKAASSTVVSKTLATMTGDGTDTTLTLLATPGSVNNVSVFLDGVFQTPGVHFTLAGNVITFTTAPASNVVVIALTGGGEHIGSPMAGSIKSADLGAGAVTSSKIASMDAAKLTGTYPALDASAVTGLTSANLTGTFGALNASAVTGLTAANLTGTLPAISGAALTNVPSPFTESANDPAINTNPSGGLGTIWVNTTSGEMYACTDATTDANVWTNVGSGSGDIEPIAPYAGTTTGYCHGGQQAGNQSYDRIDKWAFASSANFTASDVGNLGVGRMGMSNHSSGTNGYSAGGGVGYTNSTAIDKYSHTSDGDSTSHGSLNLWRGGSTAGCSDKNGQYGHVCGSYAVGAGSPAASSREKFAFSSNTTATNSGDLVQPNHNQAGNSSVTHGYCAGGHSNGQSQSFTTIQKFAFATDTTSVVYSGVLTRNRGSSGCSSTTHGFAVGSYAITAPTGPTSRIDKYSFASEADATTVGELTAGIQGNTTCSSTNYGWSMGGQPPATTDRIDRFAFASQGNATDIGNLSLARVYAGGTHV